MNGEEYLRRIFVAMNHTSPSVVTKSTHKLRVVPLLLFFISTLFFAQGSFAQLTTDTLKCNSSITINLGSILAGNSIELPLTFINELDTNDTSWKWAGGSASIKLLDSSGRANFGQPWLTYINLQTALSDTSGTASAQVILTSSSCKTFITLDATEIGPTPNASTFLLPSTAPEVIAVQSNTDSTSRLFYFKNNSGSTITIDSIRIKGTTAFVIDSEPSPSTFHVLARDSFAIGLSYKRTSPGSDNGDLVITKPDEPILPAIALQGVRVANDAVQTQPSATTYIWLYPNPTQGLATIHTENLTNARITITDILGRVIQHADFTNDWQWDRQTEGGSFAPAGTYFLIVTGVDGGGKAVHEVERIVLE